MIYEVAAAVEYIVDLIQEVEPDQPLAPEALAGFASTLKDALEKRCQRCWKPTDPEFGSAQRSVAWQLHAAGEGADHDLLRAFASVLEAQAEQGEIIHPHQSKVVALALQCLPMPFTLWIDPGCVAVRRGTGPGASRSSYDFDHLKSVSGSSSSSSSIHVIWGQMVAATTQRNVPQLTVSSAPRPIPIVKPTAVAPLQSRYPVDAMSNRLPASHIHHQRALSTSSSASSSCGGLVRSVSLSSTHTVSTDATSLCAGLDNTDADAEADADSQACPSLCSPSSSHVSSQCTPQTDNHRESVQDTTVGDATERFPGVRLFPDDDDQDDEAGDLTIGTSPMLGLNLSKDAKSQQMLGASPLLAKPVACSTPVKCNYTTHDNGNVGVLGGGVRLGRGSSKPSNSNNNNNSGASSTQAPRHPQHSKSISHLQSGLHNQLLPPYMPQHQLTQPLPRQLHYMNAPNYSAPMRTVPLPNVGMAAPQQQQQQQHYQAGMPSRNAGPMMSFAHHPSQLPTPYAYRAPAQQKQQQQQQGYGRYMVPQPVMMPSALDFDSAEQGAGIGIGIGIGAGDEDEIDKASGTTGGRRRLRSRGRRSRGRGAGRASRRQAAALRALELGSTDQLPEFAQYDEQDDDDLISRCSTPATSSEYTYSSSTASSSCYSSVTCSPAKQVRSARVSHKSSRQNFRSAVGGNKEEMTKFGLELHFNLARLQSEAVFST